MSPSVCNWYKIFGLVSKAVSGSPIKTFAPFWKYFSGQVDAKGPITKIGTLKFFKIWITCISVSQATIELLRIKISKLLYISFHTYSLGSRNVLKKTYWFKMEYSGKNNLKPQISEGIEKVKWFDFRESSLKAGNSFESIKELWKVYLT